MFPEFLQRNILCKPVSNTFKYSNMTSSYLYTLIIEFHLIRFILSTLLEYLYVLVSLLCIFTLHVATPKLNYVRSYSSHARGLYVWDSFTCKYSYKLFTNYAVNLLRTRGFSRKQYVGKLCSLCNQGYINGTHNSRRTHDRVRRQNVTRILNTTWHYHTSQRIAQLHASRYSTDFWKNSLHG